MSCLRRRWTGYTCVNFDRLRIGRNQERMPCHIEITFFIEGSLCFAGMSWPTGRCDGAWSTGSGGILVAAVPTLEMLPSSNGRGSIKLSVCCLAVLGHGWKGQGQEWTMFASVIFFYISLHYFFLVPQRCGRGGSGHMPCRRRNSFVLLVAWGNCRAARLAGHLESNRSTLMSCGGS